MSNLTRTYGPFLTGLVLLLTGVWIIGLIILPQVNLIDRAFVYVPHGGEAQQAAVEFERAQQRIATIDFDIRATEKEIAQAAAGGGTASAGGAPSPSNPFAPGAKIGSSNTVRPGLPTPGLAAPSASPAERLKSLKADRDRLQGELGGLKERAERLKAEQQAATGHSLRNFTTMSGLHWRIFGMTLVYSFSVTVLCFLVCYPIAYAVAQSRSPERVALLMLGLVIPYAINELLRIFAWVMILANKGILNQTLASVGLLDLAGGEAIHWVASNGAVFCVMIYAYILFMVFPIYNTIETLDRNQIEAARDLGASTWRIHWRVVLPHAKPGIAVGSIMTFMLSAGSISVPGLVGPGLHPDWFSQIIYRNYFEAGNWNIGSAQALLLLIACTVFILAVMSLFRVSIREIAR